MCALEIFGTRSSLPLSEALSKYRCLLCWELDKAAQLVLNVAEGHGRYSQLDHRRSLEIAANSAVKATAYLDLYHKNGLPTRVETAQGREFVSRMVAMVSRV